MPASPDEPAAAPAATEPRPFPDDGDIYMTLDEWLDRADEGVFFPLVELWGRTVRDILRDR